MYLPVGTDQLQAMQNRQKHMTNKAGTILISESLETGKRNAPTLEQAREFCKLYGLSFQQERGTVIAA